MRKLKKYWTLGPAIIIMVFLCTKSIAQKAISVSTKDESYKLSLVDDSPIFPGCEGEDYEKRKCLSERLTEHFKSNFDADLLEKLEMQHGKKRFLALFHIDKLGKCSSIQPSNENEALNKELERVFKLLPTLVPGKRKNQIVNVKYRISMQSSDGQFEVSAKPTGF